MKAKHIKSRKIIYERGCSFRLDDEALLTTSLHCHDEYELVHIRGGHGKEFIGDNVREYRPGDLILIGANLPHLFLSTSADSEENRCEILQFPKDIFPQQMDNIPEYHSINNLLQQSSRGIMFTSDKIKNEAILLLESLKKNRGIDCLIILLKLLSKLGNTRQYSVLSTLGYKNPLKEYMIDDPLGRIYGYLVNNHRQSISIENIAEYAKMNSHSICRYFKQKTGKTLFQCLTEIRIEYACKLLGNCDLTISEIAYDSGFGNQAHFNKQFKAVTGQTPTQYRRQRNSGIE